MSNVKQSRKFHFNQKAIYALPDHDKNSRSREQEYSDTEVIGLKLMVSKSGRKFFYFRYCFNRRKRVIKVGEYPMMNVKSARQSAGQYRNSVNLGIDPHTEKEESKDEMTLAKFAMNEYMPFVKNEKKTWKQDLDRLNNRILKKFGKLPLSLITNRDIQRFISKMKKDMSPSSSNRYLSLLTRMFNLAIQWDFMTINPCKGIPKAKEVVRERFLSNDEIKRLLAALDKVENRVAANVLKLLLFTGTRKSEVLTLKWANVNLPDKTFFLPITKNGSSRTVILNDLAMGVLNTMKDFRQDNNPYVFPSSRKGTSSHLVDPKKTFFKAIELASITNFRIHDLRHTYASLLVNSGVSLYEVKELLGHKDISVTQRYSHLQDDSLRKATGTIADVINDFG